MLMEEQIISTASPGFDARGYETRRRLRTRRLLADLWEVDPVMALELFP